MRHFAVHLSSPEKERERESAVSRTSCNRMIQRRTRMSLCAGNRHSMKEQTCASLRAHFIRFFEVYFAISSIGIREEKKRVAARGSQSFPLIFPSSFLSRSLSRNYDRIPLGERDAKRTDNIRQGTEERGRKGRRRVHGSARKR